MGDLKVVIIIGGQFKVNYGGKPQEKSPQMM